MAQTHETPPQGTQLFDDIEKLYARIWRMIGLRGIAAIAFGFVLLIWPGIGLSAMVVVVGVSLLVNGLLSAAAAFALPRGVAGNHGWLALTALISTGLGIAMLAAPDISAKALLYVIAGWAIAVGVIELGAAFVLPLKGGRRLLLSLSGIVLIAIGAAMFIQPGAGAVAQLALVSVLAIVVGVFDIEFAYQLRKLPLELRERFRPQAAKPVAQS
jgi:uncharacterized membrane protein HdeD (DUF308 family)